MPSGRAELAAGDWSDGLATGSVFFLRCRLAGVAAGTGADEAGFDSRLADLDFLFVGVAVGVFAVEELFDAGSCTTGNLVAACLLFPLFGSGFGGLTTTLLLVAAFFDLLGLGFGSGLIVSLTSFGFFLELLAATLGLAVDFGVEFEEEGIAVTCDAGIIKGGTAG